MSRRERQRRLAWVLAGLLVFGLVAGVALLRPGGEAVRQRSETRAADSDDAPEASASEAAALTREQQFLRARGGDRRIPRELCGPEARARMELEIEALGENEVTVSPGSWQRRTVQTQVGIASWMSKCLFDRGALLIRSSTGDPLATYDPATGFRPAE